MNLDYVYELYAQAPDDACKDTWVCRNMFDRQAEAVSIDMGMSEGWFQETDLTLERAAEIAAKIGEWAHWGLIASSGLRISGLQIPILMDTARLYGFILCAKSVEVTPGKCVVQGDGYDHLVWFDVDAFELGMVDTIVRVREVMSRHRVKPIVQYEWRDVAPMITVCETCGELSLLPLVVKSHCDDCEVGL